MVEAAEEVRALASLETQVWLVRVRVRVRVRVIRVRVSLLGLRVQALGAALLLRDGRG